MNIKRRSMVHKLRIGTAQPGATDSCRFPRTTLLALAMAICLCIPAPPAAAATYAEQEIKAAYLYNFGKFVEWPEGKSLLHLCLLGKSPVAGALEALKDKNVGERKLVLVYPDSSSTLSECDMLFLSEAEDRNLERILAITQSRRVMVVGDGDGYGQRGVMFNFFQEGGKIRFEINYLAVRRSGLKISSKLLSLGKMVE